MVLYATSLMVMKYSGDKCYYFEFLSKILSGVENSLGSSQNKFYSAPYYDTHNVSVKAHLT